MLSRRPRNPDASDMEPRWRGKCAIIVEHHGTAGAAFRNDDVIRCRDVKDMTAGKLDKEGLERLRVFQLFYLPDRPMLTFQSG